LCGGTLSLDAGNPGATYLWNTAETTEVITATVTGTYFVEVTNAQGCVKRDTINVTINPVPVVNLGNDTSMCGGTLVLNAGNPGSTYLWSNAATTQTITVTSSGTYFVDVTNTQGCVKRDTINVTINPGVSVNLGHDTTLCNGSSLILDAQNPGATYLWNDNSTASILVVNTPGTYFVTVSYTTGCSGHDTIVVTNGTPTVSLTLATNTVCANGSPVVLAGGSPANGVYSGPGVSSGSFDPTVAGTGTVSITYSYTDANTGCSNSASDVMTVIAQPSVSLTLPVDSICVSSAPITLSGGSPAAGTYSGTGVSGTSFDPSVAGVGTTTITYTYSDAITGCSNSASDVITVITNSVTLSLATHSVCVNASPVTLSGGSPANGVYSGAGVSGGLFNPSVAGTGTVTISYNYNAYGCTGTATDVMTVMAQPTVSLVLPVDSICSNATPIALSGGSPAAGNYSGTGVTGGTFDPSVAGAGTVIIMYSYTNTSTGCSNSATDNLVVKNCVGIEEFGTAASIQVYPNPMSGSFTIELPDASQNVKATLHSAEGKLIFSDELAGKIFFKYDTEKLGDGIYYLELRTQDGIKVVKLVKQF
jgi:hypothetical protein